MGLYLGEKDGTRTVEESLQKRAKVFVTEKKSAFVCYVIADTLDDTEDQILDDTPELPELYEKINGRKCVSRGGGETGRTIHPLTGVPTALWEISLEFSDAVDDDQQGGQQEDGENLENKRPTYEWESETENEVMTEDAVGTAVLTGAGEPIHLELPVRIAVYTKSYYLRRPFEGFDANIMINLNEHLNLFPFKGAPVGCVKVSKIKTSEETVAGILYDKIQVQMAFKIKKREGELLEHTWQPKVLHEGFKYRDWTTGEIRLNLVAGVPTKLNLINWWRPDGGGTFNGASLDQLKDIGILDDDFGAEYLTFQKYPYVNFDDFDIR